MIAYNRLSDENGNPYKKSQKFFLDYFHQWENVVMFRRSGLNQILE